MATKSCVQWRNVSGNVSAVPRIPAPLAVDGKFLRAGETRVRARMVTFGPFPGGMPDDLRTEFARIREAGFDAIRLYELPDRTLLDRAHDCGLWVFTGLRWASASDFLSHPGRFSAACVALSEHLRMHGTHPALAGVFVANEIPPDLVRWMGPEHVREALEELIALGKSLAPDRLFLYGNYPSTEYLEPGNADLTAFNVYLESEDALAKYLRRLHHIAGDRPVLLSEFGLDSRRNGQEQQARMLCAGWEAAVKAELAGFTVYAWSDRWWGGGMEMLDWDFGLVDREGKPKPALPALTKVLEEASTSQEKPHTPGASPLFSIIVCTRNGRTRIGDCLEGISRMQCADFETIVVDDGSTDGTADFVLRWFPWVKLIPLEPSGLSAARNVGAEAAAGEILVYTDDDCVPDCEWLKHLSTTFADPRWAAAGGPNLPPRASDWREAVTAAAPGAPTHVMLDDEEAEHLPGCNLAVRREAFFTIGGFDPQFVTAGDDVDFCWRLRDAGYRLGFSPAAFVWHYRRPSLRGYLRQQLGYGKAEALLIRKHPHKFARAGGARWEGFIYGGGPLRATKDTIIYSGPMATAGYQSAVSHMQPQRAIEPRYDHLTSRLALRFLETLQPLLRGWARHRGAKGVHGCAHVPLDETPTPFVPQRTIQEAAIWSAEGLTRQELLQGLLPHGWTPGNAYDPWDLHRNHEHALIATELSEGRGRKTLIRIQGRASTLDAIVAFAVENGWERTSF